MPVDNLYGRFAGEKILDELEKEHAEEITHIAPSSKHVAGSIEIPVYNTGAKEDIDNCAN